MKRAIRIALALALAISLVTVVGCSKKSDPETEAELVPVVEPPVIGEAGVLRVGIDLEYPPFGGVDKDVEAGIDVDVASIMANDLGLELKVVDVSVDEAATALENGEVDLVLGVPFNAEYATTLRFAGSYVTDAPAVFSPSGTTVALDTLGTLRVAAQQGSAAFWLLEHEYGTGFAVAYPTLREAFDAVSAGEADVLAGDALVGAYIARDFEDIAFSLQLDAAVPVGTVVGAAAEDLETEVRALLDSLHADGVLDTIRSKWVGDLPVLDLPE